MSRPGDTGGMHDHPKATASIDFLITLVLAILESEPLHMSRWSVITSRAAGGMVGVPGKVRRMWRSEVKIILNRGRLRYYKLPSLSISSRVCSEAFVSSRPELVRSACGEVRREYES